MTINNAKSSKTGQSEIIGECPSAVLNTEWDFPINKHNHNLVRGFHPLRK